MTMDIPPEGFSSGFGRHVGAHPNPLFDYTTGFLPRKLKDLFKYAEFLSFRSAHIYAVVRKFGEYPITRFVYDSQSDEEKARHKKVLEDDLRLKGFVTLVSYDLWLYGNAFVSVIEPIKRDLQCPHCKVREDIAASDYVFNLSKMEFRFDCRACKKKKVLAIVKDSILEDPTKISLHRWDPKLIDIEQNRYTHETVYWMQIPKEDISKVRSGNRNLINHTPIEILRAMQEAKSFRFGENELYHMKMPGPAGVQSQWGFPPISSAIQNFMFASYLRKANEAIAMEHITPFRLIHPTAASSQGDPLTQIPLDEWRSQMERNLRMFRRDQLRIQFSPIPIGVQNVGGEGRALLTLGELQEAEKSIVLSLGVPMEFVAGGLGATRGEITLRMIENQLQTHIENLNGLIQWIERKVSKILQWASIPMRLADFKMIDDTENKQLKLQLWQSQLVSNTTIAKMLDIDLENERRQRREDAIDDAVSQQKTQNEIQKMQQSLQSKVQTQALQNQGGAAYDQQQILASAQPLAEEIATYDPGTQQSRMQALKGEDFVMYSVVSQLLDQMKLDQNQAAKAQAQGQG